MNKQEQLTRLIKQKALAVGYAACGITDTSPFTGYLDAIEQRIQRYPEAAHLYEQIRGNGHPKKLADWAQSIIVCVSRYGHYQLPMGLDRYFGKYYLVDGRLPYTREYRAFESFQSFFEDLGCRVMVPNLTVRWAAVRAGLGQFGKNNFLYTSDGSWVMGKVWLVDTVLEYDAPQNMPLCPEHCTRCIDACPTGALEQPFMMNYARCIAHLSFNVTNLPPESIILLSKRLAIIRMYQFDRRLNGPGNHWDKTGKMLMWVEATLAGIPAVWI